MRLIQVFCCSLLVIGLSCTGTTTPDPQTAQRLYLEAMSLDRGDDSDRILELCRQAVEHDPEFTEAHREIIRLTEDKELLRHEYEGRVQEDPEQRRLPLPARRSRRGRREADPIREGDRVGSRLPLGLPGSGRVAGNRQSFDEAVKNYQRVLELDPTSELGHRGLARTYGRMGRREDEIAAYRKMISELPDAARGYWGLRRAYKKAERDTEAESVLQQIYERFRSDPRTGALALYELADSLENQDEKVRLWHRFIEDYPAGPNIVHVYDYLLKHYVETDREKAEALAWECLVMEEPTDDKRLKNYAYQALFDLYWKAGDAEKEARLVEELLESGYPNPMAYTHVADHYAKAGQVELALRFLERALDFANPDSVHGTVLFTSGKPDREFLEEVAGQVRAGVSYELGALLNKNRRHQEAVAVLQPVVDLWDRLGSLIHFELAAAYEATGQHQEALKHYASSLIDYLHDPAREAAGDPVRKGARFD